MKSVIIYLLICLTALTNANAGVADAELNIHLTLEEVYSISNGKLETEGYFVSGKADYLIGAVWGAIKRRGDRIIERAESDSFARTLEIINENEVLIQLDDLDEELITPAQIERDEAGNIISLNINAKDILISAIPVENEQLRSFLANYLSSRILRRLPLAPEIEFSGINCNLNDEQRLVCLQIVNISVGI